MKRFAAFFGIGCLLSMLPALASAQQRKDTLEPLRTFIQICQGYKQAPLQLDLAYKNTTNYVMNAEDTITIEGTFYNSKAGAYIRFGEMEQLVNDSVALIISERMKKMILFSNARPILAQMKNSMGMPLPDSSISNLAEKYSTTVSEPRNGINSIELVNRVLLWGTSLPKESMELQYRNQSKEPLQVLMVKRSLIPVASEDSTAFVSRYGAAGQLLHLQDNGLFFVREQRSVFLFKKITHNEQAPLPVQINDRIVKNEDGNYIPAKGYESFSMKQN